MACSKEIYFLAKQFSIAEMKKLQCIGEAWRASERAKQNWWRHIKEHAWARSGSCFVPFARWAAGRGRRLQPVEIPTAGRIHRAPASLWAGGRPSWGWKIAWRSATCRLQQPLSVSRPTRDQAHQNTHCEPSAIKGLSERAAAARLCFAAGYLRPQRNAQHEFSLAPVLSLSARIILWGGTSNSLVCSLYNAAATKVHPLGRARCTHVRLSQKHARRRNTSEPLRSRCWLSFCRPSQMRIPAVEC